MKLTLLTALLFCLLFNNIWAEEHRSTRAKNEFKKMNPCPSNGNNSGACPNYVIDHIQPLACGGLDDPSNMQWQTIEEGKAKDKWERKDCEQYTSRHQFNFHNNSNKQYYLGKRGGCFTYSRNGKKEYVNRSFCQ